MPAMECTLNGKAGWKWGAQGTCYTGPGAKQKAEKQGAAAYASGYSKRDDMNDDTVNAVVRYDQGQLLPPRQREDGSLLVDGIVTAPGVYPYWDSTESRVVWELKHPDDFATDSFARKLNALTITDEHPDSAKHPSGVRTDSFGDLAVGVTMPDAQVLSDGRTRVSGVVMRQDGIDSVQGGRTAWSLGAVVDIEHTSGMYKGKRYDRIQRNPRPNHLAFVDSPRVAGAGVRVDSIEAAIATANAHRLDGNGAAMLTLLRVDDTQPAEDSVKVIRIDGIDVPEAIADQVQQALDKRDNATAEQKVRADEAIAERDALKGQLEVALKRDDDAGEELAVSIREALTAYDEAKPVADHMDVPIKDSAGVVRPINDVRRDCLVKHLGLDAWGDAELRSDDAVAGAFEALAHRVNQRDDQLQSSQAVRSDSQPADYEQARRNYHLALTGQQ